MTADVGRTPDRTLRLRALLVRAFPHLMVLSLAVAGLGTYLTVDARGAPETRVESRVVSTWTATGSFDHAATVGSGTATEAFPAGTVLENRSLYFLRVAPELDGRFVYAFEDTAGGNAAVAVELVREYRSAEGSGPDATVHWRVVDPLSTVGPRTVAAGDRLVVPFAVNVTAAGERLAALDGQVGGSPGSLEVAAVATVTETRPGAEPTVRTYRMPVAVQGNVYTVTTTPAVESGERTEPAVVRTTPGPVGRLAGPALAVVGLAGAVCLVAARRTGRLAVTAPERTALARAAERAEFEDWITVGTVPAGTCDRQVVAVSSLAGLVDLAIDTDRRVVEDATTGRYLVPADPFDYVYDPERGDAHDGPAREETVGTIRDTGRTADGRDPGRQDAVPDDDDLADRPTAEEGGDDPGHDTIGPAPAETD